MTEWFSGLPSVGISQAVSVVLVLLGAGSCAVAKSNRRAVMGLWAGQLGSGALLLGAGAELLAVLLWISVTLTAAVYFLHADLFPEHEDTRPGAPAHEGARGAARSWATLVFPAGISAGFGAVVWVLFDRAMSVPLAAPTGRDSALKTLSWNDERLLALELTTLFALAATVGAGVISRARRSKA